MTSLHLLGSVELRSCGRNLQDMIKETIITEKAVFAQLTWEERIMLFIGEVLDRLKMAYTMAILYQRPPPCRPIKVNYGPAIVPMNFNYILYH